ncbi:hypothetical protein ACFFMO_01000 [Lederbergia wuyishanensis]
METIKIGVMGGGSIVRFAINAIEEFTASIALSKEKNKAQRYHRQEKSIFRSKMTW